MQSSVSYHVRGSAHARLAALIAAGLALLGGAVAAGAAEWPNAQAQLAADHVAPGSALERLILQNQDFDMLDAGEASDSLGIPPWLRVLYRKNHPQDRFSPQ